MSVAVSREIDLVRGLWAAYQARDWAGAQSLFAPAARCTWWTSGERYVGAEAIIRVNATYPEGWQIHVVAVEPLADGRVLSLVRVDHPPAMHYAHSWFGFAGDDRPRIASIDEFWAEVVAPEAWRDGLSGREREAEPCHALPPR